MGNSRQMLKEKITQDLQHQIESTKKIVMSLEKALVDLQRNSAQANQEIQDGFEELYQTLIARKIKLISQVDEMSSAHGNRLQESIHQTYLELGSLQSTLCHIDSFDMSQLENIQLRDLQQSKYNSIPSIVNVELASSNLKDEIAKWGSVDSTNSEPKIENENFNNVGVLAKPNATPCVHDRQNDLSMPPLSTDSLIKLNALDFDVDHWLREIKSQTSNENEEFEMLFMESDASENATEEVSSESSKVWISTGLVEEKPNSSEDDDEDKSSITCMDSNDSVDDDLSKWLKPKKTTNEESTAQDLSKWLKSKSSNNLPSSNSVDLFPPELLQGNITSQSNSIAKPQYIDYPGLRLGPECWIHKKAPKQEIFNYNFRAEFNLAISDKQIIPPTYALPYPFWLKRC